MRQRHHADFGTASGARRAAAAMGLALAGGALLAPRPAAATTLQDALVAVYSTNPALLAARAQLRSVDENVPQALAGWRPTITLGGSNSSLVGWAEGRSRQYLPSGIPGIRGTTSRGSVERDILTPQAVLTQPLYRGGLTRAQTHQFENKTMSQRAQLLQQEQQSFSDAVNAYVGVIEDEQLLILNVNNEQVLAKQLQATNDRFRVGEITRTDVAQAEAALAGAKAQRQTAEGNLATQRATYERLVGMPPGKLADPQPLALPVKSEQEAKTIAGQNNPNVVAALFNDASNKDAIDTAFAKLQPTLNLQATYGQSTNALGQHSYESQGEIFAALSVPIYQGGSEYALVRQARQTQQQSARLVDDARRTAIAQAAQAWETLDAAKATVASTRSQIRANEIALEGTQREAIVGSRTTLDVLNAEQLLLTSRVTLIQNLASLVNASYSVAFAIGRLTASDLKLHVPLYDMTAYYNAVRNRWFGTGDYATDQPGR